MPVIAIFYGLEVSFYFNDHVPPHVHVKYNGKTSMVSIETGEVLEGELKGRGKDLIKEWIELNREELMQIWEKKEAKKLPPLV